MADLFDDEYHQGGDRTGELGRLLPATHRSATTAGVTETGLLVADTQSQRQRQLLLKSRPSGVLGCHEVETGLMLFSSSTTEDEMTSNIFGLQNTGSYRNSSSSSGSGILRSDNMTHDSLVSTTKDGTSQSISMIDGDNDHLNNDGKRRHDGGGDNDVKTKTVRLRHRSSGVGGGGRQRHHHHHREHHSYDHDLVKKSGIRGVILPWSKWYHRWWVVTVVGSIITAFFLPYQLAFQRTPGSIQWSDPFDVMEVVLNAVFTVDIAVSFHLATYQNELLVFNKKQIRQLYIRKMFWVDMAGVFPFEMIALWLTGNLHRGSDSNSLDGSHDTDLLYFSLWRLPRFVRLYRLSKLNHILQYDGHISLLWFTLLRNFAAVLFVTHFEACAMYYLARLDDFSDDTWLGPIVQSYDGFERYIVSLYTSIVTLCTVGYGDFSPKSSMERIVGSFFMIANIGIAAWVVGSVTLLVLKSDEEVNGYRESLETLRQYGKMHEFDSSFMSRLKSQLRLTFQNREISDEAVLKSFPSSLRRRILRKLYLESLLHSNLMKGVRQQFVDAFLASCTVEIFSPGEEIVQRNSILSDLYLLVGGVAEITTPSAVDYHPAMSNIESRDESTTKHRRTIGPGQFIGEIAFFTSSPQAISVSSLTTCKTLTITQSQYKNLENDHPGSTGKILENLLSKVEEASMRIQLPQKISVLRAGSVFQDHPGSTKVSGTGAIDTAADNTTSTTHITEEPSSTQRDYGTLDSSIRDFSDEMTNDVESNRFYHHKQVLTAVTDLVKMHVQKQLDDQTTRLLFAASRGDSETISLMLDQGFDVNNSDYDNRTALMVASMKGQNDIVRKLLIEYKADPNRTDVHGITALFEAVKNGHEETIDVLKVHGARVSLESSREASVLCQAVFDGDIMLLRRLLRAGINVDAADYDKRTACHIAAAEGNLAAFRTLANFNANLTVRDRWGSTCYDEAHRVSAKLVVDFINNHLTVGR